MLVDSAARTATAGPLEGSRPPWGSGSTVGDVMPHPGAVAEQQDDRRAQASARRRRAPDELVHAHANSLRGCAARDAQVRLSRPPRHEQPARVPRAAGWWFGRQLLPGLATTACWGAPLLGDAGCLSGSHGGFHPAHELAPGGDRGHGAFVGDGGWSDCGACRPQAAACWGAPPLGDAGCLPGSYRRSHPVPTAETATPQPRCLRRRVRWPDCGGPRPQAARSSPGADSGCPYSRPTR